MAITLSCGSGSLAPSAATPSPPPGQPPEAYCLTPADQPQAVQLHGINGQILGTGSVGLVLTNGSNNDPCLWHDLLPTLLSGGRYRLLLYFYRDSIEESIAEADSILLQKGVSRVIMVGQSLGGGKTLLAAPHITPAPAAAISLSGESDPEDVRELKVPTQIFASEDDRFFRGPRAREVFAAIPATDKELHVYPGTLHGVDILIDPSRKPALMAFLDFLARH
jgi:pimeloyl-ACP methyl ester carboxylesterase